MLVFNKLSEGVLYRTTNKYTLPFDADNKYNNNLVAVFGEDIEDTGIFLNRDYLVRFNFYKRYYIDKKVKTNIAKRQILFQNDAREIYEEYNKKYLPNLLPSITPSMVGRFNTVYEFNQYTNLVKTNERLNLYSPIIKAQMINNLYMNELHRISKLFPNHKKFLYFPVDKYMENTKNLNIWRTKAPIMDGNKFIIFIKSIEKDYDKFKSLLSDWTFIFLNVNELFYLQCKNFNSDTYENIISTLFKCRSRRFNTYNGETDDNDKDVSVVSNSEVEKDVVDINIKNGKDVLEKSVKEINDSNLSEEEKKSSIDTIKNIVKDAVSQNTYSTKTVLNKTNVNKNNDSDVYDKNILTDIDNDDIIDDTEPEKIEVSDNKVISKDALDSEIKKTVAKTLKSEPYDSASVKRLARTKKIQENIQNIKIDNFTIKELAENAKDKQIEDHKIKADVINEDVKNIKFYNFEKDYNEKLLDYDFANILTSFAEKDKPLYLIKLDKKDISNNIDNLYEYNAVFEDQKGMRHSLTFNVPKFMNNKFIHLNGSDKLFINQVITLPVTKTSADEVQMSSNYNKIFIRRFGKNVSLKITKFNKILPTLDPMVVTYSKGNELINNAEYMTTIEYDELSSRYNKISLIKDNVVIYLNRSEISNIISSLDDVEYDKDKQLPFAIETLSNGNKEVIFIDIENDVISGTELSPIDYIVESLSKDIPDIKDKFSDTKTGSKLMYTRATIMGKKVPIVLLLGFLIGLYKLLDKLNIDYEFSEKETKENKKSINMTTIKFKDGYLSYNSSVFSNALIINGLYDIPTEEYNFLDFSSKEIYYNIFQLKFGRQNIGNAFENFEQLFIDPVTKEVLEDYNLPTNFVDLVIYANSLLENNTFIQDGDLSNYRIRSNELLNAHIYKVLSKAYEKYRLTADSNNPTKMSIKKNAIINDIYDSQLLEEYSTLNPIYEIDRMRSTSYKGPGGCNVDDAFKIEKRAYNDSMLGIFSQSSPISGNIGISRTLSIDPNVTSLRGYIKPGSKDTVKSMSQTKLLSGAELLLPMAATHDDPQRVSMASTQSRHTLATIDSDVPLFGYGFDKVLSKVISDRFAFKAKDNGVIEEINEKLGYMILSYDNGSNDVVDISNKQSLNTGSGFYIENKLTPNLKVGDKFSADDIVARDDSFFTYDEIHNDTIYKSGPLARVALIHGSSVFEDSTIVTERLAERLSSYITEEKTVKLGKNSNIYKIVNIGDTVKVGDPLIVFDESYSDKSLNAILKNLNEKEIDDFIESGRSSIKSKFNGEIVDVKIYYTVPKEELSDSIKSVLLRYEKPISNRNKNFKRYNINTKDITTLTEIDSYTPLVNGKIKGEKMDDNQVLIEFYIKTKNKFSVGDKLTYSVALKGINHSLIPKGKEPYLASDKNEIIDAFMSISGYYSRMTNSFILALILNTLILGAEKKIKDILNK